MVIPLDMIIFSSCLIFVLLWAWCVWVWSFFWQFLQTLTTSFFSLHGGHQALWDQGDNLRVLLFLCPDRQPHILPLVSVGPSGLWEPRLPGLQQSAWCTLVSIHVSRPFCWNFLHSANLIIAHLFIAIFQNFIIICCLLISYTFFPHFIEGRKTCKCHGQYSELNQEFTICHLSVCSTTKGPCLLTHPLCS